MIKWILRPPYLTARGAVRSDECEGFMPLNEREEHELFVIGSNLERISPLLGVRLSATAPRRVHWALGMTKALFSAALVLIAIGLALTCYAVVIVGLLLLVGWPAPLLTVSALDRRTCAQDGQRVAHGDR
jgi:hypothetical protein